mgnify:CR=1 FL=1
MRVEVFLYILVMAAVTYLIRMLPLTLIRKPIKSRVIRHSSTTNTVTRLDTISVIHAKSAKNHS